MQVSNVGSNRTEILHDDGTRVLVSYSTPVAVYVIGQGYMRTSESFSRTTSKHISQWMGKGGAEIPQTDIESYAKGRPVKAEKPRAIRKTVPKRKVSFKD